MSRSWLSLAAFVAVMGLATTAAAASPVAPQSSSASPASVILAEHVDPGTTVLLAKRTKIKNCKLGALPDRSCSPGAYYSGLTKNVICSKSFRTGDYRNVPDSKKHAVEHEYGLTPGSYGNTLEIDHIVSLELGGSNDIANLFPEEAKFASHQPGFRIKDKLETKLHRLVCGGEMTLRDVQKEIAANWKTLYKKVYGVAPTG